MPTKQQSPTPAETAKQETKQQTAVIGGYVLRALGQPGDLHLVQVRPLWEGHYRVNVLVGADASSVRVAHSYFLVADGDGNILTATPAITRQY